MNNRNFIIAIAIAAGLLAALLVALNIAVNDALLGTALIAYPFWSPSLPQLMLCSVCKIDTVHHRTPSGEWVCWCGTVAEQAANGQMRKPEFLNKEGEV